MKILFSNRYVDALTKTIFLFGLFHLAVLTHKAFQEGIQVLNAFAILNLDSFAPHLSEGFVNFVLSYLIVLIVYCLVYVLLTTSKPDQ